MSRRFVAPAAALLALVVAEPAAASPIPTCTTVTVIQTPIGRNVPLCTFGGLVFQNFFFTSSWTDGLGDPIDPNAPWPFSKSTPYGFDLTFQRFGNQIYVTHTLNAPLWERIDNLTLGNTGSNLGDLF